MKLEVGKFYKHKENNSYLSVIAKISTTMWEDVLVGESPEMTNALIPLDEEIETDEWEEITEKDWLERFDPEEE